MARPGNWSGQIEVIAGSMFSGKTEELLRLLRRAQIARQKTQVFKPALDHRYGTENVQSHDASKTQAIAVEHALQILELTEENTLVVGIDEAQFFDEALVGVAERLAFRGKRVILAGLDLDYTGRPFGPMPQLLAIAEKVTKLAAICVVCGGPASRSQRLVRPETATSESAQVLVGGFKEYEPRCRMCHDPAGASPGVTR